MLTDAHANDIACMTEILENRKHRFRVKDTDLGQEIRQSLEELHALQEAYQHGEMVKGGGWSFTKAEQRTLHKRL